MEIGQTLFRISYEDASKQVSQHRVPYFTCKPSIRAINPVFSPLFILGAYQIIDPFHFHGDIYDLPQEKVSFSEGDQA